MIATIPRNFAEAHEAMSGKVFFDFSPASGTSLYAVEKDEGGVKHRYLYGISSGVKTDGHGEHMTANCIESFQRQAKSGDILLYVGKHDVNFVDDVGKLVGSQILPNFDWQTMYRLYDESDQMGPSTMETVDKIWRQVNGIAPYKVKKVYGFSIEGDLAPDGLLSVDIYGRRAMDDVQLAGVVLVRKPAYQTSIAYAVAKALEQHAKQEAESADGFYDSWYQASDTLDDRIRKAMSVDADHRTESLEAALDAYKSEVIRLCLQHPDVFRDDPGQQVEAFDPAHVYDHSSDRLQALREKLEVVRAELDEYRARHKGGPHAESPAEKQGDAPYGDPQ